MAEEASARMAVVVIAVDAAVKEPDAAAYGGYELFIRAKLDERVVDEIRRGVREAILEARYAHSSFKRDEVRALTTVESAGTREITDTGERASSGELNMLLPGAFMFLLMMGVMTGGQYLLTTTIEEKSSRVVEVILSAVSPMQLMTGKIIGQMAVGLLLLGIYAGLGLAALGVFAMMDLVEPISIVYLIVFFALAYFMLASLLAAVGSAVNDIREAQALQTPVMLVVMVPWILWLPISQSPNSTLAVVLSFLPPISPFVMMMRVTSTTPPPTPPWQILASIAVAAIGCYLCLWFAAKVFRVGLLMYGKPPNLATLIRWVRMA
jgi:ABC-2 type transport system permease protein